MKIICDGHEYSVTEAADAYIARNNYGVVVAEAIKSPCKEYWIFEHGGRDIKDTYHAGELTATGYTVQEQLVRWYAATDEAIG